MKTSNLAVELLASNPKVNSAQLFYLGAKRKINLAKSIPFFAFHATALVSLFFIDYSLPLIALCLGMYFLRMFGITAGYHRYFSHRSYKTNRVFQFVIAWIGSMSLQKGVLWWAANHRHHHKFSDMPQDIHSPVQSGFWWSHVGWILSTDYDETKWDQIGDLTKYPELVWINKYHLVPPILLGVGLFLIGGWNTFAWGFLISTVLLWHGTFTINSLSHVFGSRRFQTTDTSKNNFVLALITMGEGWHNNHHCYMSSVKQGFYWWEIDMSYYVLKTLSWFKVTSDLRGPPLHLLETKKITK